jgi:hypothetical protein
MEVRGVFMEESEERESVCVRKKGKIESRYYQCVRKARKRVWEKCLDRRLKIMLFQSPARTFCAH